MNFIYALRRRRTAFAVLLTGLVLGPVAIFGTAPAGQKSKSAVERIVNHNKAPKVVKWKGDPVTERVALFPEDYDWKEDERVGKALGRLREDRTEEVWEEMVNRTGDRRYCQTVVSGKTGDAYVEDVGSVCTELAYSHLIGVYWQHLPASPIKDGERLFLDIGIGDLSAWRKHRAAKSLHELQIEACERAIDALAKAERVPQVDRVEARKKIESEIGKLKKTRQPVAVLGGHRFEIGGVYNDELAKRVREGFKSGRHGPLDIIK